MTRETSSFRRVGRSIDGTDFGAAYIRIWLGDHAIDGRLRDQLLGCPRRDVEDVHAALPAEHGVP